MVGWGVFVSFNGLPHQLMGPTNWLDDSPIFCTLVTLLSQQGGPTYELIES